MILPTLNYVQEPLPGTWSGYIGSEPSDHVRIHFSMREGFQPYVCAFVGSALVGKIDAS